MPRLKDDPPLNDRQRMLDLGEVRNIELLIDQAGKAWININGMCVVRVGRFDTVSVEDSGKLIHARSGNSQRGTPHDMRRGG